MYRQKMNENKDVDTAQEQVWSEKNGEVELVKEDTKMIPAASPDANTV
jgi:hypothetical protein